eukprot:maker-scaffold525_size146620-snap-gene-0.13 protein:Tk10338 transcript:maker-scaffold525_size146620-snap-gene-0.13-mRNA-1 annotation:"tld domain-containing protein kiaa1609 homolog"
MTRSILKFMDGQIPLSPVLFSEPEPKTDKILSATLAYRFLKPLSFLMGNETSSVKIHSLLTAEDIKGLRGGFPGGGNGDPPTNLDWGQWKLWRQEELVVLEKMMRNEEGHITFHGYQEVAGSAIRGQCEGRVKLLFHLLGRPMDKTVKSSDLSQLIAHILEAAAHNILNETKDSKAVSETLAQSLMHELLFPRDSPKFSLHKKLSDDILLDCDMIERWLVMTCPLFDGILLFILANSFGVSLNSSAGMKRPPLVPKKGIQFKSNTWLRPQEVIFLNSNLPGDLRDLWRPLFNSRIHGESFSKLSAAILKKGPTLLIVWEKNGNCFGGYASTSWTLNPKFVGDNTCFLFSLTPKMFHYEATRFNTNYMYMNLKQKTMANGLGMGGQMDFFGLWIDSEYGKGRCAPSCSSYSSPQLSKEEHFHIDHLEVWGVGEEPADLDEENTRSVLDVNPETQAVMEMMGKTFVSKDLRAGDDQMVEANDD